MAPKTATSLLLACALLSEGCRAVIGIEELRVDDASVDGSSIDAPTTGDASDGGVLPDTGTPDAKPTLVQCAASCRAGGADAGTAFFSEMHTCICQGGNPVACKTECAGYCPQNLPTPTCEACILKEAFTNGGACSAKVSTCTPACTSFVNCVQGCQ